MAKSIFCVGGRFGYKDQGETANTQLAIFDYGESLLVFDARGLSGESNMGVSNQVYFNKNENQKNTASHGIKGIKDPLASRGKVDIFENFIEAVRSRKEDHLDAHVYEGHVSSGLCHLANISYRLGEKSSFSKEKNAFGENKQAYEYFERMQDQKKMDSNSKKPNTLLVEISSLIPNPNPLLEIKRRMIFLLEIIVVPTSFRKRFSQLVILNQTRFNIPE